jgi:hypothetical protein
LGSREKAIGSRGTAMASRGLLVFCDDRQRHSTANCLLPTASYGSGHGS